VHLPRPGDALRKIGSTGKALLHTEMRIVNDDGDDCGPDEIGELWVAGPHITPGLLEPPRGHRGRVRGSLAEDRRRRADGRRGLRLHRRPVEGHVHLGRRERVPGRGRERALPAPRGGRGGGHRRAERQVGRGGPGGAVASSPAPRSIGPPVEHCVERLAKFKVPTTSPSSTCSRATRPARCSSVNYACSSWAPKWKSALPKANTPPSAATSQ
jgi:fatty-acyl-CoA synthase